LQWSEVIAHLHHPNTELSFRSVVNEQTKGESFKSLNFSGKSAGADPRGTSGRRLLELEVEMFIR
jgi:hypothetical protein